MTDIDKILLCVLIVLVIFLFILRNNSHKNNGKDNFTPDGQFDYCDLSQKADQCDNNGRESFADKAEKMGHQVVGDYIQIPNGKLPAVNSSSNCSSCTSNTRVNANGRVNRNDKGQPVPKILFSDSASMAGVYGRPPTHIVPLVASMPGSTYRPLIETNKADLPAYTIRIYYTRDCYMHPLMGVFSSVQDLANKQYPEIKFERIKIDPKQVTNYIEGRYNANTGFINYSNRSFPLIQKVRANGDVLTYHLPTNVGSLYDWVMNEALLDVPSNNI